MGRYTEAYSGFVRRIPEVEALYGLAISQDKAKGPFESAGETRALCRAGVVLLSSHIEGYIEDLAETIIIRVVSNRTRKDVLSPRFLYHFSKDIIDEIGETEDPDKISLKMQKLWQRDKDIWNDNEIFSEDLAVERFISGFSTPRFDEIRRFVSRFGYNDYKYDLNTYLQADFQPCVNMVDNVVNQRNKIAHGDAVVAAAPRDLVDMVRLVKQFCRSTDVVVGNWFRTIGCSIR